MVNAYNACILNRRRWSNYRSSRRLGEICCHFIRHQPRSIRVLCKTMQRWRSNRIHQRTAARQSFHLIYLVLLKSKFKSSLFQIQRNVTETPTSIQSRVKNWNLKSPTTSYALACLFVCAQNNLISSRWISTKLWQKFARATRNG